MKYLFSGRFIFALLFLPATTFAHWPAFIAPDLTFLRNKNYIHEEGCMVGSARLDKNLKINIKQELCVTYCPMDWTWVLEDDGNCHELGVFKFQKFEINHIKGANGNTSYSEVETYYGKDNTTTFKFKFRSKPEAGWFCALREDESQTITCANDT